MAAITRQKTPLEIWDQERLSGTLARIAVAVVLATLGFLIPFLNVLATPFFLIAGGYIAWRHWDKFDPMEDDDQLHS